jgi:hypothetical protein
MWFDLAAAEGNVRAVLARDLVAAKMTPLRVAEAQELARAKQNDQKMICPTRDRAAKTPQGRKEHPLAP